MTFGAIQRCKNCQGGQIVFRSGVGYFCLGHKDEWVKCETVYEKPVKKPFVVPKKLKKDYPFLYVFFFLKFYLSWLMRV